MEIASIIKAYLPRKLSGETSDDVWFDQFSIQSTGPIIVQETHYDPWGVELEGLGYQYGGIKKNRYLYNAKEHITDNDINIYDYGARTYNPVPIAIGSRWSVVDPMAELAPGWTPYRYGFNNPVKFIDPDGMFEYSDGYSTQDSKNSTGAISFSGSYIDRTINTDYIEFSTGTGDNRQVLGGYTETYVAESGTVLSRKYFGSPYLFGAGGFGDMDGGEDSFLPMSQGGGSGIGRPLSTGAINPDYTIEGFTLPIFGFLKALNLGRIAAKEITQGFKSLGAAGKGFSKTLQTGGHTLNKSTLKALGLSKQQGKIAIEGLKKDIGLPPNFHGKIMGNGDLVHPNSGQVLGNLFDYLY